MTRICVASHSFQHSAQIFSSTSAPRVPGSPTLPAPSRVCAQRAQVTAAISAPVRPAGAGRSGRPAVRRRRRPGWCLAAPGGRGGGHRSRPRRRPARHAAPASRGAGRGRPGRGRRRAGLAGPSARARAAANRRHGARAPCSRPRRPPGRLFLRRPEDVADLLHRSLEIRGSLRIDALLVLAAQLRGLPERVVEVRVLLEVLRLEVVGPEDEQLLLAELRVLLLHVDRADVVVPVRVVTALERRELLDHLRDGLGGGLCAGRIVDAARDVAVRVRGRTRRDEPGDEMHGGPPLWCPSHPTGERGREPKPQLRRTASRHPWRLAATDEEDERCPSASATGERGREPKPQLRRTASRLRGSSLPRLRTSEAPRPEGTTWDYGTAKGNTTSRPISPSMRRVRPVRLTSRLTRGAKT